MKTIFVPTDFSEPSFTAAFYACNLWKALGGKIILFHADFIPVPLMGTIPVEIIVTPDELRTDSESRLKQMKASLLESSGTDAEIELLSRYGNPQKEILSAAEFVNADLIIAGMHGEGVVKEMIMGSTATKLMHSSIIPVLVVPDKTVFKKPDDLVFATDGKGINPHSMNVVLEIALSFQSAIHIVHVYPQNTQHDKEEMVDLLDSNFINLLHMYDFIESNNTDEAIENYMKANDADMLVIIPRRHNFFEKLFTENHAKHLAFHSHIPVLALPDL